MSAGTGVLTEQQARQITGGRKPHVPIQYEQAVKALSECISLDEVKLWSDKSDALAAWAKIYHDKTVDRTAKKLKLHAYRRMGELAREIRPNRSRNGTTDHRGPKSALIESGLNKHNADAALRLSRMKESEFKRIISSPRLPTPRAIVETRLSAWSSFNRQSSLGDLRAYAANHSARDLAASIDPKDVKRAKMVLREVSDWLDEFDHYLPKGVKA